MNYTLPLVLLLYLVAACTTGIVTDNATEDDVDVIDVPDANNDTENTGNGGIFDDNETGIVDDGMINETDSNQSGMMDNETDQNNVSTTGPQGTLTVGVTDDLVNTNNLESLSVTVDNVQVRSEDGWVSLSGSSEVDLLELADEDEVALVTSEDVPEGSYDAIRFDVSSVEVIEDTIGTSDNGSREAVLPSSEIMLDISFEVSENETTAVTLDFLADESLYTTIDDEYVFAPVIRVMIEEDARVSETGGMFEVRSGTIAADERFEMDVDGMMNGTGIEEDAELTISGDEVMYADDEEDDDDNATGDNST